VFELKITGGTIVDGTGRAAFEGDVAIEDGRIAAVGDLRGQAADRTIDAAGAHVLPGFVDIHTHYDGQATWDVDLLPSSLLGVTTCVMGSCGVGFAPVKKGEEQRLVELMEGVEDIPGAALAEGIPWGWESVGDYLDFLAKDPRAIDVLVQVPHDPVRMYVMGERAVAGERATDDDIAAMRRVVRAALEAGAAGFSTGRSDNHRTAKGAETPASECDLRELVGIARAFEGLDHGVVQAVSDFDMARGPDRFDGELALLVAMAEAAGRPMSISTMQRDAEPGQWKRIFAGVEAATARGLDMRCQVAARGIGVLLGLEATFHPFMGFPTYKSLAALPLPERVAMLRRPEVRAAILAEKTDKLAGDGTPIPPLADVLLANIEKVAMRMFPLGARPDYEPKLMDCIAGRAARTGGSVLAAIYDALLEEEGKALLYFPIYNYASMNLDTVREMLVHPRALVGLGDAGAHVGTVCDASMPAFLVQHWGPRLGLPRVVRMQTHDTARFIGLHDRGTLEVGMRADLNVIELPRLTLQRPELVRDLPAGGKRLFQRADGFVATLVGGAVIAEQGALTGVRPGRLVRMGGAS